MFKKVVLFILFLVGFGLPVFAGVAIKGGASSNLACVDSNSFLCVNSPTVDSQMGGVKPRFPSSDSGLNTFDAPEIRDVGRMGVGVDSLRMYDNFDGTALNTNLWITSTSTMTITQSQSYANLNAGNSTAINAYAIMTSIINQQNYSEFSYYYHSHFKINVMPEANATAEIGVGTPSGTSSITDAVFCRWGSDATFKCGIDYNGVETLSGSLTAPAINVMHVLEIYVNHTGVRVSIDETDVYVLNFANTQSQPRNTANSKQPVFARVYNSGTSPTTAMQLNISEVLVAQLDLNNNKSWGQQLVGNGRGAYQSPVTTWNQTASWANGTAPASASLNNTVAGYTALGGLFQFAAVASSSTDYDLFAYQVPSGFQLYVTSISISMCVTGADVATTASLFQWGVGINSSAASLATVENPPTSWATRRVPLGMMGFIVGNVIGSCALEVSRRFDPPLVVDSLRYISIIMTQPIGTATASEIFRGTVGIDGYFE